MMQATAPCKINLFLQIVGRNRKNYHLLESIFAFTEFGDVIIIEESGEYSLDITGEFASQIDGGNASDNLVTKAYDLLGAQYSRPPVKITLTKNIPIGAGIGGGSADAATTLLLLNDMYKLGIGKKQLAAMSLPLGADIPACIYQQPIIVSGIGENITAVKLPKNDIHILLVNPRIHLPTPPVFSGYKTNKRRFSPRISGLHNVEFPSLQQFMQFIASKDNDLTADAEIICPEISVILDLLHNQDSCLLSRMSGSGATCFGVFPSKKTAVQASEQIAADFPTYWLKTTELLQN